jgi:hypothetical protein
MPFGLVGIYGSIGDELGMIDRASFTLGPDVGRRLALSFIGETKMPEPVQRVIAEGGSVGLSTLASWGVAAHVNAPRGREENRALDDALIASDVRRRMALLLAAHAPSAREHELARMQRIAQALASSDDDPDLRESLRAILAFEECYRLVVLGFQRLLWTCQTQEPYSVELRKVLGEKVIGRILDRLPAAADVFQRAIDEGQTQAFVKGLETLNDARTFIADASRATTAVDLVERILARHRNVQHAKMDGGRRKMPWLEARDGTVTPTLASAMRVARPPERVDDVLAHPYRTVAADHFRDPGGPS